MSGYLAIEFVRSRCKVDCGGEASQEKSVGWTEAEVSTVNDAYD
ncbi:MAG: hypothetical protein AB8G99_07445 [Planctomycetaceae bacterium]